MELEIHDAELESQLEMEVWELPDYRLKKNEAK